MTTSSNPNTRSKPCAILLLLPPRSFEVFWVLFPSIRLTNQTSEYTGPLFSPRKEVHLKNAGGGYRPAGRFHYLQLSLSSEPVLKLHELLLPFVLRTDTSNHGLGVVLLQYHQDCPHPVVYVSRKLLDRERRYSTIERECQAIVFGILRFHYYLQGKELILEVDDKPTSYLRRMRGKMARYRDGL